MIWSELTSLIEANQTFCITTHQNPDGDSIGSQLAFYWYLRSQNKDVVIFDKDPVPQKFCFLRNSDCITNIKPTGPFDVLCILDSSNPTRIGWEGYAELATTIMNIDHHRDNSLFGAVNLVDGTAAATGMLLYDFFKYNNIDIPDFVAESLYAAMLSDTGGFRFSNTNGLLMQKCGDLLTRGADAAKIYQKIYVSFSSNAVRLHSAVWSTMRFYHHDKICVIEMPLDLIQQCGASYGDAEGLSDLTTLATEVMVGVLIKYRTAKETNFSLRSKGAIDVGLIAQNFPGGGGHGNAAGCTLPLPLEEARQKLLDMVIAEIDKSS